MKRFFVILTVALAACSSGAEHHGLPNDGDDSNNAGGDDGSNGNGDDSGASPVPRLAVVGANIVDPSGNTFIPRGWNWGQWGTMQPTDAVDNAAQGATIVRIPLRWWGQYGDPIGADVITRVDSRDDDPNAPGHIEPHHLAYLDATIQAATDAGLWVDLFIDSNCGQASVTNDTIAYCGAVGSDPANFANDADTREEFTQVWEFIADRYKDHPGIGMYELLPEPNFSCDDKGCDDWKAAAAFYEPLIARVRAIDARTPILVGPTGGYDVDHIDDAHIDGVDGLIYTGNFLNGPSGKLEKVTLLTDFVSTYGAPVFVQQVGSRKDNDDPCTRAQNILGALNSANVGWTWWTYREHSANGDGFAPYWSDGNDGWQSDPAWLACIDTQF